MVIFHSFLYVYQNFTQGNSTQSDGDHMPLVRPWSVPRKLWTVCTMAGTKLCKWQPWHCHDMPWYYHDTILDNIGQLSWIILDNIMILSWLLENMGYSWPNLRDQWVLGGVFSSLFPNASPAASAQKEWSDLWYDLHTGSLHAAVSPKGPKPVPARCGWGNFLEAMHIFRCFLKWNWPVWPKERSLGESKDQVKNVESHFCGCKHNGWKPKRSVLQECQECQETPHITHAAGILTTVERPDRAGWCLLQINWGEKCIEMPQIHPNPRSLDSSGISYDQTWEVVEGNDGPCGYGIVVTSWWLHQGWRRAVQIWDFEETAERRMSCGRGPGGFGGDFPNDGSQCVQCFAEPKAGKPEHCWVAKLGCVEHFHIATENSAEQDWTGFKGDQWRHRGRSFSLFLGAFSLPSLLSPVSSSLSHISVSPWRNSSLSYPFLSLSLFPRYFLSGRTRLSVSYSATPRLNYLPSKPATMPPSCLFFDSLLLWVTSSLSQFLPEPNLSLKS